MVRIQPGPVALPSPTYQVAETSSSHGQLWSLSARGGVSLVVHGDVHLGTNCGPPISNPALDSVPILPRTEACLQLEGSSQVLVVDRQCVGRLAHDDACGRNQPRLGRRFLAVRTMRSNSAAASKPLCSDVRATPESGGLHVSHSNSSSSAPSTDRLYSRGILEDRWDWEKGTVRDGFWGGLILSWFPSWSLGTSDWDLATVLPKIRYHQPQPDELQRSSPPTPPFLNPTGVIRQGVRPSSVRRRWRSPVSPSGRSDRRASADV